MIDSGLTPEHHGQNVTLKGMCFDAKLGAVVLLSDRTPVYIRGLEGWPSEWMRKTVHATGRLERADLAPDPVVNDKGEVSHGMSGQAWSLVEAEWTEV